MTQQREQIQPGPVWRPAQATSLVRPAELRERVKGEVGRLDAIYDELMDSMVDDGVLESTPEAAQEFVDVVFEQPIGE